MPTPNFEDAPDGLSSVNHTGTILSEEAHCFWEDIDPWADIPSHLPQLRDPSPWVNILNNQAPPHPSYADGSAPAVNPLPNLNTAAAPFPVNAGETVRRLQTVTEVNEVLRRTNPEGRPIPANPNPVGYSSDFPPSCSPPRRVPRRPNRRGEVIRKDPNAWTLREAVELCKLLEVVVPEAGFHIALTGGLLYKEGRRKDCDLMFYQIRQMEPNYEILWKYLTVAGVIRSPSYPENGWLVKATYRGKLIDCLFPNAGKKKKAAGKEPAPNQNAYQTSPPTPPLDVAGFERSLAELDAERITAAARYTAALTTPSLNSTALCGPGTTHAILEAAPYTAAELLATPAPAPVPPHSPVSLENGGTVRYDPETRSFRTEEPR